MRDPARPAQPSRDPRRRAWLALPLLLLAAAALRCAVNPATGRTELSLVSESEEVAIGRQNHQQILQTMGAYDSPELQNYVQGLGRQLSRTSERPNLPWTFTLLDDTAINAFALPGGFIYVTRGILAHMNSEGELAGVMGHEVGHVTAKHSVSQMSRAQVASVGLLLGSVVAPQIAQMGDTLQQSLGLLFLKYSRDAERQADDLGVRYMSRQGYAPIELADILGVLDRVERASGGSPNPDWLSTHPNPGDRVAHIKSVARGAASANTKLSDRNAFLRRLQGLAFGDDPRQGYFEGDVFYQPDLALQLVLPREWKHQNTKQALIAASPDGQAVLRLALSNAQDARQAASQFFAGQQQGGPQPGQARSLRLEDFDALDVPFGVTSQSGSRIAGHARFVQDGRRVYELVGYGLESSYRRYEATLDRSLGSFSRVRDRCRLEVQPERVEVVEGRRGMTLQDLLRGAPPDVNAQTLAILNHVDLAAPLEPGQLYKRITSGRGRC